MVSTGPREKLVATRGTRAERATDLCMRRCSCHLPNIDAHRSRVLGCIVVSHSCLPTARAHYVLPARGHASPRQLRSSDRSAMVARERERGARQLICRARILSPRSPVCHRSSACAVCDGAVGTCTVLYSTIPVTLNFLRHAHYMPVSGDVGCEGVVSL